MRKLQNFLARVGTIAISIPFAGMATAQWARVVQGGAGMHSSRRQRTKGQRAVGIEGAWVMCGLQIIVGGLAALVLFSPAQAAVFNIPAGDVEALIAAINTANGNNEDDTINLAAGTYTLQVVNNDTDGPNGLPSIRSGITVKGAGEERTSITRDAGAPPFRIVHVA